MYDYLEKGLKRFLHDNTVAQIENSGSRVWFQTLDTIKQSPKPKINVVFSRYQGDSVNETILGNYGYVLAIPSYWIDVDCDLATIYISSFVDKYLADYFGYTINGDNTDDDTTPGCDHNCNGHPHHPPHHHHHDHLPPEVPICPVPVEIVNNTLKEAQGTFTDINTAPFTYGYPVQE